MFFAMDDNKIHHFFDRIWPLYEILNHIITLGLDIIWRNVMLHVVKDGIGAEERCLDVGCGTGEMTRQLARRKRFPMRVVGIDFSMPMLRKAVRRNSENTTYVMCDARLLPFADCTFNLVTMAFAARNLRSENSGLTNAIGEIARVLVKGGRFINLETTQHPSQLTKTLIGIYARIMVGIIGRLLRGSREAYHYLYTSYREFYSIHELANIIHSSGLSHVEMYKVMGGLVAIHRACK